MHNIAKESNSSLKAEKSVMKRDLTNIATGLVTGLVLHEYVILRNKNMTDNSTPSRDLSSDEKNSFLVHTQKQMQKIEGGCQYKGNGASNIIKFKEY